MILVCEGIFQIGSLGMELWDKTFSFKDNLGLLVLKIIVLKNQAILKIFPTPHQKKKENIQFEMCHKLILQNMLRPGLEKVTSLDSEFDHSAQLCLNH